MRLMPKLVNKFGNLIQFEGKQGGGTVRGVAYWEKNDDCRILFGAGHTLYAVNAKNGKLLNEFGNGGGVEFKGWFKG